MLYNTKVVDGYNGLRISVVKDNSRVIIQMIANLQLDNLVMLLSVPYCSSYNPLGMIMPK